MRQSFVTAGVALAIAFTLAGPPTMAHADVVVQNGYTFVSYQVPGAGPFGSSAFGISNSGVILGNYDINDGNSTIYGFIQQGNSFTSVPGPAPFAGTAIDVYKMNSAGNIVGDYLDPANSSNTRGFQLGANGKYTLIDFPAAGVTITTARGINDAGTIVGRWDNPTGTHGFFLSNGVYSSYDVPGSTITGLWFINNKGQFGGDYETPDGITHGLIVSGSTITTVDIPGSTTTIIHDLNNNGIAVGIDVDPVTGLDDSFLFNLNTGRITPFAFPGSTDTDLYGINDAGVIAGTFDSFSVAFIATPVPEPSSLALLSLGGLALAGWRRWKKRATA